MPWRAMSKAVPWSTDVRMMGSPSVTLTALPNADQLHRDQALVVIHRDDDVEFAANGAHEERVGRERAGDGQARLAGVAHGGRDHAVVLDAEQALFARVGIQPRHANPRRRDPKGRQRARGQGNRPAQPLAP